jgi:hypothetical protein
VDDAVKAPRARERLVQRRRAVGGRHDHNPGVVAKPIHLRQQLVDGVHRLVVAHSCGAARLAQAIKLVDEDDAGGLQVFWYG